MTCLQLSQQGLVVKTSMRLKELRDLVTTNDWTQVQSCWWSFGCAPVQWFRILTGQSRSCEKMASALNLQRSCLRQTIYLWFKSLSRWLWFWSRLENPESAPMGFLCSKEHKEHVGLFVFSWFKFLLLKHFYLVNLLIWLFLNFILGAKYLDLQGR